MPLRFKLRKAIWLIVTEISAYRDLFEVTNVGANHDLMELFKVVIEEPELS